MDDVGFREWLKWNGAATDASRNTRVHAVRKIETSLRGLGFDYLDLDAAYGTDRFETLRAAIRDIRADAVAGGQRARVLMPESESPQKRLPSWNSWLAQYGRFIEYRDNAGETEQFLQGMEQLKEKFLARMPDFQSFKYEEGAFWDTEAQYKQAAQGEIIFSANEPGKSEEERGREIYKRLSQSNAQGLPLGWRTQGEVAKASPEVQASFYQIIAHLARLAEDDLAGLEAATRGLENLRTQGLPNIKRGEVLGISISVFGTVNPHAACWFKVRTFDRLGKLLLGHKLFTSSKFDIEDFEEFQTLLYRIRDALADWEWEPQNLTDVQGFIWVALSDSIESMSDEQLLARFDGNADFQARRLYWSSEQQAAFCRMARAVNEAGLDWYHTNIPEIRFGRKDLPDIPAQVTFGSFQIRISESFVRCSHRNEAVGLQGEFQLTTEAAERFAASIAEAHDAIEAWLPPNQTRPGKWPDEYSQPARETDEGASEMTPINLILYGPPGTGKTFATAEEAVRLCGVSVPDNRGELMEVYHGLCEAGRIEFVTFHQSMSYEDFVEGKQPVTGGEDGESGGVGFRLEAVHGIFRRIVRRAETSRGHAVGADAVTIEGRQVFKTSIGEAANPEDAYLFEEAIAGGHTLLGFEDIDWSDEKYASRDAIIEACRELGAREGKLNAMSGRVQMPFIFRNWVKPGDIIVVSKGNALFRAIGEVTGGYEFHPRPEGGYAHRRAVRWLWVDREGVPVSEIYRLKFTMRTIYELTRAEVNIPALERYMNSQLPQAQAIGEPDPFVLIIDEINRANISKVFGELITLLEPDKRLGQPNQLKVRLPYSGDKFGVPSNLHILGTMNTADRSIALLDTALRRRFDFRELMPDPSVLSEIDGINLPKLLAIINERIEYLFDREHQIGHAYFVPCRSRAAVDSVMRHKVIPLLAEYFYEDWHKIAAVLGDTETHEQEIRGGFLTRTLLKAPPGLESDRDLALRFRWSVRGVQEGFDYSRLLGA